jgi:hypothetical protein
LEWPTRDKYLSSFGFITSDEEKSLKYFHQGENKIVANWNKIIANWTHLIIKNMTDFEVGVAEGSLLGNLSWLLQKHQGHIL